MNPADFDLVEKILVINLEERTDRRVQIQKQLTWLPSDKIIFVKAIRHENGKLGCALSHIKALELAQNNRWKNVLILEDDMIWVNEHYRAGIQQLHRLMSSKKWNIILLGALFYEVSHDGELSNACGAHAYLIKSTYYNRLSSHWKQNLPGKDKLYNAIDLTWHDLMKKDKNWFLVLPILCIQSAGYSDIGKKVVPLNQGYDYKFKKKKNWLRFVLLGLIIILVLHVLL